jgi:hypothetical protein
MKQALVLAAVLGVSLVAGFGSSQAGQATVAKTYRLTAAMTPSQVVTPRNRPWRVPAALAKSKGSLSATLDTRRRTLTWRITYSGLGAPPIVIADVHIGKRGRFGAILVRLCAGCKSGQKGVKKLKATAPATLLSRSTWLTLITDEYPNGVVRGQIKVL